MLEPVARLRRLAPALRALGDDGAWLGGAIERWLNGSTFEAACNLAASWRHDAAREARDEALRELAAKHFPGVKVRPQADAISEAARRLQATGADLGRVAAGGGARGAIAEVLLMTTNDLGADRGRLPRDRRLREILGNRDPMATAQTSADGESNGPSKRGIA